VYWAKKSTLDREKWSNKIPNRMDKIGFLSHNLLVADKASMKASLELRVPYLSERILSERDKLTSTAFHSKRKLVSMCKRYLPSSLLVRKKEGCNPPLFDLVARCNKNDVISFVQKSGIVEYIEMEYIRDIVEKHYDKKLDSTYKIWQLVYLSAWVSKNK